MAFGLKYLRLEVTESRNKWSFHIECEPGCVAFLAIYLQDSVAS